jgi:hypothetical protein
MGGILAMIQPLDFLTALWLFPTSVLLLIPTISYLVVRAVQQGYVLIWYIILLVVLLVPNLIQTLRRLSANLPKCFLHKVVI